MGNMAGTPCLADAIELDIEIFLLFYIVALSGNRKK